MEFIVYAVAIAISAYLLPGIHVDGVVATLVTALILGIINAVLKPILQILALPLTIVTLGLFSLVINALMVMLAAAIVPGFSVDGFWWALIFAIVLSVISGALLSMTKK